MDGCVVESTIDDGVVVVGTGCVGHGAVFDDGDACSGGGAGIHCSTLWW